MKTATSIYSCLVAALLMVLSSGGIAAALDPSNTQLGNGALANVTTGTDDTALGARALHHDTTGADNTATGWGALRDITTGNFNTANGTFALLVNNGSYNTAHGYQALGFNSTGDRNSATGAGALSQNNTGSNNTATGFEALHRNLNGNNNSAVGQQSLFGNRFGFDNTGVGVKSLYSNDNGTSNTAIGRSALFNNSSGHNNIGVGFETGNNLTTGDNNIEVGNPGIAGEASTIRLGTQGTQKATYIAGITGSAVTGSDVVISSAGRLGVVASSARYKKDISDMGESTDWLMKLRPVTFRYKDDQQGTRQYGLVAEEVEQVYPELVVHDADGKVESVRYSMLTSMLLNELQKQTRTVAEVKLQLKASQEREKAMRTSFDDRISRLERVMAAKESNRNLAAFER